MQLHWGWAGLGAVLLVAGFMWWTKPGTGERVAGPDRAVGRRHARSDADAGPTLYRWVDSGGVVNVSSEKPRAGVHYTIVHINPDQNIVPMTISGSAADSASAAH